MINVAEKTETLKEHLRMSKNGYNKRTLKQICDTAVTLIKSWIPDEASNPPHMSPTTAEPPLGNSIESCMFVMK